MNYPEKVGPRKRCLIMGIGNYIMGDEGVGPQFVKRFENEIPEGIDILDGGTGGFLLMPSFEEYEKVILIDAIMDGTKAGTIKLIQPRFSKDFPRSMSTHDIGLKDVIDGMSLLGTMPDIFLFTVSIGKIQNIEIQLSPAIEKAMVPLKRKIDELIMSFL